MRKEGGKRRQGETDKIQREMGGRVHRPVNREGGGQRPKGETDKGGSAQTCQPTRKKGKGDSTTYLRAA